jgi:hypothetical protein
MDFDPSPTGHINDLESAQLALRGAVASVRSLQDVNLRQKEQLEELSRREKIWKQRIVDLEAQSAELQAQWKSAQRTQEEYTQQYANQIRSEVALEEQEKWQRQLTALNKTLETWRDAQEKRELELQQTRALLAQRDQDFLTVQREKITFEQRSDSELTKALEKARAELQDALQQVVK